MADISTPGPLPSARFAHREGLTVAPDDQPATIPLPSNLRFTKFDDFDLDEIPLTSKGYTGRNLPAVNRCPTAAELLQSNFERIKWDGTTPHVILDKHDRIVIALVGQPEDAGKLSQDLIDTFEWARQDGERSTAWPPHLLSHRRGTYSTISCGISLGGGQESPRRLTPKNAGQRRLSDILSQDPNVKAIVGYQSTALCTYAPKIYKSIRDLMVPLCLTNDCKPIFDTSVMPAFTLNMGPQSVAFEHTDALNAPHSMCPVSAFGTFDPTLGGHLVLFDLGIFIDFPSGSTILIPSSILRHGNTSIQPHERRYSLTQYCAGALFRWAKYGHHSARSILQDDVNEQDQSPHAVRIRRQQAQHALELLDGDLTDRRCRGLSLFSKIGELHSDYQSAFGRPCC